MWMYLSFSVFSFFVHFSMLTNVRGLKVPTWNTSDCCFSASIRLLTDNGLPRIGIFRPIHVTRRRNSALMVVSRRVDVKMSLFRFFIFHYSPFYFHPFFKRECSFFNFIPSLFHFSSSFLLVLFLNKFCFSLIINFFLFFFSLIFFIHVYKLFLLIYYYFFFFFFFFFFASLPHFFPFFFQLRWEYISHFFSFLIFNHSWNTLCNYSKSMFVEIHKNFIFLFYLFKSIIRYCAPK